MRSFSIKQQVSRTVDLPGGGSLTLRPVTTPVFEATKAVARKKYAALIGNTEGLAEIGINPATDLQDKDVREGLYMGFLIAELGLRLITGWSGIADETGDKEAEVTADNIHLLLQHPLPAKALYEAVLEALLPDASLKKDSGTVAAGTSAAVPPIAADARASEPDALRDNGG